MPLGSTVGPETEKGKDRPYSETVVCACAVRVWTEGVGSKGRASDRVHRHAALTQRAYHGVCVGTRYCKQEPETDALEEALSVGTDEVADNTPVETRHADTQYCSENEEEGM